MDQILHKHITVYFDRSDTPHNIVEKIPSTKALMAPVTTFMQHSTSKAVVVERIAIMIEKQLKMQNLDINVREATRKSV